MIKIGPVGGSGYTAWNENGHCEIVQIFVSHGDGGRINSIQFQYAENGTLVLSNTYGKSTGLSFDVVRLDYPSEYLTWVSGHKTVGPYGEGISSLAFGTNRATHGRFGCPSKEDKEFRIHLGLDRQFGGFHGTIDFNGRLSSVGVYFKPITTLSTSQDKNATTITTIFK